MTEIKGTTWDFDGNRLSVRSALALFYVVGFRGRSTLTTIAAVTAAESQRYARAWHHNHEHNPDGTNAYRNDTGELIIFSTDHGLTQLNREDMAPFSDPIWDPKVNAKLARQLWRVRGFQPWAAFNSGAYEKFLPEAEKVYDRQAWRLSIPRWED